MHLVLENLKTPIVDYLQISAYVPDAGCADSYELNFSPVPVEFYDVTDLKLVLKEHEHTGYKVGNQAFSAKAYDQSYNSDTGEYGVEIEADG